MKRKIEDTDNNIDSNIDYFTRTIKKMKLTNNTYKRMVINDIKKLYSDIKINKK